MPEPRNLNTHPLDHDTYHDISVCEVSNLLGVETSTGDRQMLEHLELVSYMKLRHQPPITVCLGKACSEQHKTQLDIR